MTSVRFRSLVRRAASLAAEADKASCGNDQFRKLRTAIRRQIAMAVRGWHEGETATACEMLSAYGDSTCF